MTLNTLNNLYGVVVSNSSCAAGNMICSTRSMICHTGKSRWATCVLLDFSLSVKAATLIFISGRCSDSSSAKQDKSGSIYKLVNN